MKITVLATRREVMKVVTSEFPGGQACAAAHLGIKPKRLQNQIYETAGCTPLSDEEILALEAVTGTRHLAEYVCSLYDCVPVALPAVDQDNTDLYARSIATAAKRGTVDLMIAAAMADGEIDAKEAAEILAVHKKHIAARHEEVRAVIALHAARA